MRGRLFAALAAALALAGCGGSRLEVANDSGVPITGISVELSGSTYEWDSIEASSSVSRDLQGPVSGMLVISYTSGLNTVSDTLGVPPECESASTVSIWIYGDATSVKYDI